MLKLVYNKKEAMRYEIGDGSGFNESGKEQLITVDIDLSRCKESRKNRPYITLHRPEMYF